MNEALVTVAIQALPNVLDLIRLIHGTAHPGTPEPTDAEVIAALNAAVASSIAKDEDWLAHHPDQG